MPEEIVRTPHKMTQHMDEGAQEHGKSNPGAPPELASFAFLIGTFRCDASLKLEDGSWRKLQASWEGRYVLDGYAIMDQFRMMSREGDLLVLGMNVRAFDVRNRRWTLRWLNALDGTWLDLAPEELGDVETGIHGIAYSFREPVAGHSFTRARYTDISTAHFTWRGERSNDRKTWDEFLVIKAFRTA